MQRNRSARTPSCRVVESLNGPVPKKQGRWGSLLLLLLILLILLVLRGTLGFCATLRSDHGGTDASLFKLPKSFKLALKERSLLLTTFFAARNASCSALAFRGMRERGRSTSRLVGQVRSPPPCLYCAEAGGVSETTRFLIRKGEEYVLSTLSKPRSAGTRR
jgi:hypothetical protein